MNALRLTPVVVSALVLGAHFFRAGEVALALGCVLALGLLAVPRAWAARTLQAGLLLGALEWARTAVLLVAIRQDHGMPWLRLAAILGAVAVFTLLSAAVFRSATLASRYRLGAPTPRST